MIQKNLEYTEFEINMVYGFKTKPFKIENFNELIKHKRGSENTSQLLRDGWSTFYKMTSGNNDFIQNVTVGTKKEFVLCNKSDNLDLKWDNSHQAMKLYLERSFSIRKDGVGTVTLSLKFCDNELTYNTSDILKALMLAPRTIWQENEELSNLEGEFDLPRLDEDDETDKTIKEKFSPAFKLFLSTMKDINSEFEAIPVWEPLIKGDKVSEYNPLDRKHSFFGKDEGICDNLANDGDSQIPYFFVFAKTPYDLYRDAFLDEDAKYLKDKHRIRSYYTKEISSILGRWLNDNNIKYASTEYWKSNSAMTGHTYETQFMNSLVFTVFSAMLALTIYPDTIEFSSVTSEDKDLLDKPINVTHETILRFLEFTRTRWHSAIVANYGLDIIIDDLPFVKEGGGFLNILGNLLIIQEMIALNFENPSHFLLDSSLGSSLSNFFNSKIINEVEEEVSKKLEHTRNLLKDHWQFDTYKKA